MIPVTFNSATAYLIDDAPDWATPPQLKAQLIGYSERGLTGREARQGLAEKLRLSLSYSAILEDSEQLTNFRNALQDLKDKLVLCPLWVYPIEAGATPEVTADFYALLGDGADPEIGEAADLPFSRPAFPLMVGKFSSIPDPVPFDDEKAAVTIAFEEAEEWATTLPENEFGAVADQHEPVAWLKADSLSLSDGDSIATWADSSGNGNDAVQATGGVQPTYKVNIVNSLPVVRFGLGKWMQTPAFMSAATEGEIFAVLKANNDPASGANTNTKWWFGSASGDADHPNASGVIEENFGTTVVKTTANPSSSLTSWHLYNVDAATNDMKSRLNNVQIWSTVSNTVGFGSSVHRLGAVTLSGNYFDGDIAEILVYDRVLTDDERADVVRYLSDKYGFGLSITGGTSSSASDIFPFRPNWAQRPKSGNAEVDIDRQKIGTRRQVATAYFSQRSRRHIEQAFTLEDSQPWQLLRLFQDLHGASGTFWLPTGISDARLTVNVAAIDDALTVDNPTGRGDNAVVILDDLTNRERVTITDTAGNDWNLDAAVGTAFDKNWTRVESAAFARFDGDSITLTFDDPTVARATLQFVETPWEVGTVSGETDGTTMGQLPLRAYLYVFSVAYPGATQTWRYAGYEIDLTNGGNTYANQHFEHDSIRETLNLERQQVSLTSRNFSGNPLALMIPFQLEWPLMVSIIEADVDEGAGTVSNLRTLFAGEVESASFDGPFINATAKSLGSVFDRRIPRRLLQPGCNYAVFESSCGLLLADWKWQGTVTAFNSATLELAINTISRVSGSAVTLTAHYFAGGFMYFGAGAAAQYRMIADSTAIGGGAVTLVLGSPFTANPAVGDVIYLHPGCTGSKEDCGAAKFNNLARFGGFPFMPVGNPSAIKVSKNATSGGKKG